MATPAEAGWCTPMTCKPLVLPVSYLECDWGLTVTLHQFPSEVGFPRWPVVPNHICRECWSRGCGWGALKIGSVRLLV